MNENAGCPRCRSEDHRCYDSRIRDGSRLRRRECFLCHHRWLTLELTVRGDDDAQAHSIAELVRLFAGLNQANRNAVRQLLRSLPAATELEREAA
jgi:transcriptional regulator NrdR family protein